MNYLQRGAVAGIALLVAGLAQAAGDPQRGQTIVMQGDGSGAPCLACHGMDGAGNDMGGFPRLAGMDAGYLIKQMQDYRSGARTSAIMAPNVDNLSDEQMADVAAYYAAQQGAATSAAEASAEVLALGEKLVKQGDWDSYLPPCETCHGPGSLGVGATFPELAGQHASYLKTQLQAWQQGTRSNDPNQLMLAIAARLSPEQIEAVAAYLARQPQHGGQ